MCVCVHVCVRAYACMYLRMHACKYVCILNLFLKVIITFSVMTFSGRLLHKTTLTRKHKAVGIDSLVANLEWILTEDLAQQFVVRDVIHPKRKVYDDAALPNNSYTINMNETSNWAVICVIYTLIKHIILTIEHLWQTL